MVLGPYVSLLEISKKIVPDDRPYSISSRIESLPSEIISNICDHASLESRINLSMTSKLMAAIVRSTTAFSLHVANPSKAELQLIHDLIPLNIYLMLAFKVPPSRLEGFYQAFQTSGYFINFTDASFAASVTPLPRSTAPSIKSATLDTLNNQSKLGIVPARAAMRMLASKMVERYRRYHKSSFLTLKFRKSRVSETAVKAMVIASRRVLELTDITQRYGIYRFVRYVN
jgi:hypothetical protein